MTALENYFNLQCNVAYEWFVLNLWELQSAWTSGTTKRIDIHIADQLSRAYLSGHGEKDKEFQEFAFEDGTMSRWGS